MDDQAVDRAMMRIDEHNFAGELRTTQVARDHCTDRPGPWGRTDQCNGPRIEQLIEITNRHRGGLSGCSSLARVLRESCLCGDSQSLDKIVGRITERCQLRVISFGDVDDQPLCESGNQIKKIHRVDVELVAQFGVRVQSTRVRLWRNPAELVDQYGGYIVAGHSRS